MPQMNLESKKAKFLSLHYLFQDYSLKSEFKKVSNANSKLFQKLFPFSSGSRLINKSDMLVRIGEMFFSLLVVKT